MGRYKICEDKGRTRDRCERVPKEIADLRQRHAALDQARGVLVPEVVPWCRASIAHRSGGARNRT